jgi:predicted nucleic acid-binding protein
MSVSSFYDTNIIVYAFSNSDRRGEIAYELLKQGGGISVQILNEFTHTARRKLNMSWPDVIAALNAVRTLCPQAAPITLGLHEDALTIAERFGYRVFDAMIIAAAITMGCATLYSEDMQHGQIVQGMRIVNPFV